MAGFNLQELMSQAKRQYESLQKKMQETIVEGSAGGGTVTVKMDGSKQVLNVKIDPEAVKAGDLEMLQDLITAAMNDAEALAGAVRDVKAKLRLCSVCNNITDVDPCVYCSSATRNQRLVCVVEEPTNIAAIEKTKHFNGVYHVLHGSISPLNGVGPEQLRISSLIRRVENGNVDEVILATNPTVEGEATATYLSGQLRRAGLKITRIAMGIPVGSDIEYTDEITMLKAMEGRREL